MRMRDHGDTATAESSHTHTTPARPHASYSAAGSLSHPAGTKLVSFLVMEYVGRRRLIAFRSRPSRGRQREREMRSTQTNLRRLGLGAHGRHGDKHGLDLNMEARFRKVFEF